jgi:hypothetical protein
MWRREEELGYWLTGDHSPQKPNPEFGISKGLPRKFGFLQFRNIVKEGALRLEASVIGIGEELPVNASIQDGFGSICRLTDFQEANLVGELPAMTFDVKLIGASAVRSMKFPDEHRVRVQQFRTVFQTNANAIPMRFKTADVHSLECYKKQSIKVNDGERMFTMNSEIGDMISDISALPHMRKSLDIAGLEDRERQSFLREAEALKKVPVERAELIAVFRHVPIEAISRLRFLAENRIILYSISGTPKRSQTRVHDMAAVRDTSNQEIHLVPHRTRFQLVSLN